MRLPRVATVAVVPPNLTSLQSAGVGGRHDRRGEGACWCPSTCGGGGSERRGQRLTTNVRRTKRRIRGWDAGVRAVREKDVHSRPTLRTPMTRWGCRRGCAPSRAYCRFLSKGVSSSSPVKPDERRYVSRNPSDSRRMNPCARAAAGAAAASTAGGRGRGGDTLYAGLSEDWCAPRGRGASGTVAAAADTIGLGRGYHHHAGGARIVPFVSDPVSVFPTWCTAWVARPSVPVQSVTRPPSRRGGE